MTLRVDFVTAHRRNRNDAELPFRSGAGMQTTSTIPAQRVTSCEEHIPRESVNHSVRVR